MEGGREGTSLSGRQADHGQMEEGNMPEHELDGSLAEARRKEIFEALVEAQDQEMTVEQSRQAVSARFGVSEGQLRLIEREGIDNNWPPL